MGTFEFLFESTSAQAGAIQQMLRDQLPGLGWRETGQEHDARSNVRTLAYDRPAQLYLGLELPLFRYPYLAPPFRIRCRKPGFQQQRAPLQRRCRPDIRLHLPAHLLCFPGR